MILKIREILIDLLLTLHSDKCKVFNSFYSVTQNFISGF